MQGMLFIRMGLDVRGRLVMDCLIGWGLSLCFRKCSFGNLLSSVFADHLLKKRFVCYGNFNFSIFVFTEAIL